MKKGKRREKEAVSKVGSRQCRATRWLLLVGFFFFGGVSGVKKEKGMCVCLVRGGF